MFLRRFKDAQQSTAPSSPWRVLIASTLLIVIIIVGQTWWASAQDRRISLEAESASGLVATRGLEEHASQILHSANRAIDVTIRAIRSNGQNVTLDPIALREILQRQKHELPYLQSIRYLDQHGISQITSFEQQLGPIDVSDRQYVQFMNAHPERLTSLIGEVVQSRYDKQWIIPVVRNLFNPKGERVGMISAYIRVAYFERFYQRLARDNRAILSLISDNGFMLIRSPADARIDARTLPVAQRLHNGAVEGSFQAYSSSQSNMLRLYSYRRFADFPVTAIYARNVDDILHAWRQRTINRVLFAAMALACIMFLTLLLMLHIRRLQRSGRELRASESRYRILYEGGNDAVLLWNRQQIYVDCNRAALRLFGLPDKQHLIGRVVGSFSPTQQSDGISTFATRQLNTDAALSGKTQRLEWAINRDGKPYYSDITLSRAEIDNQELVLAVLHDINARKRAQALHSGQNHILHLIAAGEDLHDTLEQIVRFIEQQAPHVRCAFLLLDDPQTRFIACIAPGLEREIARRMVDMPVLSGNGCCSEAVLSRCPVIVEDTQTSPLMTGLEQWIGPLPFASAGSWPVMTKRGQVLAAFSMLYIKQQTPDADDMQLIGISTDLAGIAIESRKAEERITHLAHYDELTDLPNRFLFIQHLDKGLAHAERQQSSLAVLFLDLDRFKNINDTFGHEAGDQVLRYTATRMRACLRDQDILARVGGDEFLALVEDYHDPIKLSEITQRLLQEAAEPFEIQGQKYHLSVSIGIAAYPTDGIDAQSLLKNADIAMYRAKTNGKNIYQFYSAEMNTHTVARVALEARLRVAIERREFVVYYQPKIELESGCIVGAEALVRWQDPERGLIFPGDFITLAEDTGLIGSIGMLVLDIVCQDSVRFSQLQRPIGRIAINLSANQFNQSDLLEQVTRTTTKWAVPPSLLEFEITESMVMHNHTQAIELMDGIRQLGFTLSIDDFGTGYSSLAYLKRFPVNSVKIDKSFVDDIPHDANSSAIVQAIIVMSHSLGLDVVAEGVETKTQLDVLRAFGCDMFQGFYFSQAVPADEFIALVNNQSEGGFNVQVQQDQACQPSML